MSRSGLPGARRWAARGAARPESGSVLRRPAVLGTAVLAAVVLGAGTYVALGTGVEDDPGAVGAGLRVAAVVPSGVPAPSTTDEPQGAVDVRNPFSGGLPAPSGTRTEPGGTAAPAAGAGAGMPTPTVTRTVPGPTVTVPGPTVTVTTTATSTARPVYLGLYGVTIDDKAQFRVNDDPAYTVAAGAVFAKTFKFVRATSASPYCAEVLYGDDRTTLCAGDVKRVG